MNTRRCLASAAILPVVAAASLFSAAAQKNCPGVVPGDEWRHVSASSRSSWPRLTEAQSRTADFEDGDTDREI